MTLPSLLLCPGCQPFSNDRLIKLAAAMSTEAAVSSRQELYPRNMEALRALRLGIGALSGLGLGEKNEGFTIVQVHNRVSSRYPAAMPLPTDPRELELMLQKVGIDVRWEADAEVYRRRDARILATSGHPLAVDEIQPPRLGMSIHRRQKRLKLGRQKIDCNMRIETAVSWS